MANKIANGTKFYRLTLLRTLDELNYENRILGEWKCDCGNVCIRPLGRVKLGYSRSCGCLVIDTAKKSNKTHGWKGTREYRIWAGMRNRCKNPNLHDYPRYGGRGIRVCNRWEKFENFIADMGPCPTSKHSIDRKNGEGNYELSNCRWATPKEQARNNKRIVYIMTPKGIMAIVDYAASIGITHGAAHMRLKKGKLEGCNRCLL